MSSIANQAIASFNQGNALYKSKNYEKALESYEATLEQDSSLIHAYLWKAKTLIQLGRYEEGINCFLNAQHRFRDSKRESYTIQLLDLLVEKGKPNQAMDLVQKQNINLKDNHPKTHLRLLFANNHYQEGIHDLLQLPASEMHEVTSAILENDAIPEILREKLSKEKVIPRYIAAAKQQQLIKKLPKNRKELKEKLSEVDVILKRIKTSKDIDYTALLTKAEAILDGCKLLVLKHGELLLKTNNLKQANAICKVLETCHYDEDAVKGFTKAIKQKEQTKTKKRTKYAIIGSVVAVVLGIVSYYAIISIQKSSRYKEAIVSNNLGTYNTYLNRYGDDKEIHRLRELKLYNIAVETNQSKDINALISLYPKSSYLKTITLSFNNELNPNVNVFGIASPEQSISPKSTNTFSCPVGSKVGYNLSHSNKVPIHKYFTVVDDMTISETMQDKESLLFEESFNSNTRGWTTYEETKQVYGRIKSKGAKVRDGSLQLYHHYSDNKFVMSSIYLDKLKGGIDFKIVFTAQRNGNDNGTFLLFGATKRAFNYIGFDKTKYLYGYNNWDNSNQNWVKESKGWQYSNAINRNNNGTNTLELKKEGNTIAYHINGTFIGSMPLKKWYGQRLGFGVNDRTQTSIQNVKVYQIQGYTSPEFRKDKLYFCSVEELNVRGGWSTKDKVLTTIKRGDPVKYLGDTGKKKVNATLNGVYSPDYYYKVELLDGSKGWVHGGGIASLNTDTALTIEAFRGIQKSNTSKTN